MTEREAATPPEVSWSAAPPDPPTLPPWPPAPEPVATGGESDELPPDASVLVDTTHQVPVALSALLASAALLRIGIVGSALAVTLDLKDLGHGRADPVALGLVVAGQAVSEMLAAPILARYADRMGRRRFLVGGPLVGMVCSLLVALATTPLQIGGFRLLEGVAAAAFIPTALGLVAAATSHQGGTRAQASGVFEGATLLGYAGGGLLGPFCWHYLHRGAFLVMGLLYLSASLICHRFVPSVPPMPVSPLRAVIGSITGRGPIRAFVPAWLCVNALVAAFYINIPAMLVHTADPHQTLVRGLDDRLISPILICWITVILLGIALWTPLLKRLGPVRTMRSAAPGAAVLAIALFIMNHVAWRSVPMVLPLAMLGTVWLAGFGPAAVAYLSDTSERMASDRSALMAFYTLSLAGGGAVGALLGGLMTRWLLFDGLLLLGVALIAVAGLALAMMGGYEHELGVAPSLEPWAEGPGA